MNEEIEYAKMLEIPVSTINVLHKNRKLKFHATNLKEKLIAKVNEEDEQTPTLENDGEEAEEKDGEEINTVRVGRDVDDFYSETEENQEDFSPYLSVQEQKKQKRANIILSVEFAAACALCGAIFLTNVFMPNSAINTFFTSLAQPKQEQTDTRTYTDFELGSVLGAYSEIELELSDAGVLSFTGEGCVYPVADGKVANITQDESGLYTVTVAYSDSFQGVISGLDFVYYQQGQDVKGNVPMGFSKGQSQVQVTMYSQGELLSCFEMDETNCLTWVENAE